MSLVRKMQSCSPAHLLVLVAVGVTLGLATHGYADEIKRSGWVPNVGSLGVDEQPLGDLWTFECKPGQTVTASVDTKDDLDTTESCLDPVLKVVDGQGNLLAFADDNIPCSKPPVCGFACPQVVNLPCGVGNLHSLIVRDFGTASTTGVNCNKGGGYELTVQVLNADGTQELESRVRLGGGPNRRVPQWALDEGKAPVGPALDDENVPNFTPVTK